MIKKTLPLAAMEKVLRKVGAERVADNAKVALREVLEEIAEDISSQATKLAVHAGRKTVKSEDIRLASK
ncbi:NFYB/HAP3 family transcription factor subunit [Candidatus Woesearchaeota archaeon]|jgi:histone H3/H4|nr:NFYB/HAP3 family transcription factor subunit [Candidatus Woesearchaeota archaeon]